MNNQTPLRRIILPTVKIFDAALGICDYVASDETVDSYREVIKADGWRFTNFKKNSPFVDSHNYETVGNLLGKVVDFEVKDGQLIERVQWAIDVPENKLAALGWKMTVAGYLKAVSVGFWPTRYITPSGSDEWHALMEDMDLEDNPPRCVYLEQEQIELSACVIGANPNALAKAYHAKAITEAELDFAAAQLLETWRKAYRAEITEAELDFAAAQYAQRTLSQPAREPAPDSADPALESWALEQARQTLLRKIHKLTQ